MVIEKKRTQSKHSLDIQTSFASAIPMSALSLQIEQAKQVLERILPAEFFSKESEEKQLWLTKNLPLLKWNHIETTPDSLSLYFLCISSIENHVQTIFLDLLKKWLIPEKEVQSTC